METGLSKKQSVTGRLSVTLTTVGMFNVGALQSSAKEYLTKPYKEVSWS